MATAQLTLAAQVTTLQQDLKTSLEQFFATLPDMESNVAMIAALTEQSKAITVFRRDQTGKIIVSDGDAYILATEQVKALKSVEESIEELMDPFIDRLFKAHRTATAIRKSYLEPGQAEQKRLKLEREMFAQEQERMRRDATQKAQEEARQREEARLLEEARQAAATGNAALADAILEEAATVEVAPVALPSTTPQIAGTSYRSAWDWKLLDQTKLKPEFLIVDETAIGKIVRSMHKSAEQLCGPGAIAVTERKVVVDRS